MPIYMQFGELGGDAETTGHTQWVEINSFQFGVERQISSPAASQADREGTMPSVSEIVVTKDNDAASPNLFRAAMANSGLTIHFVSGKSPTHGPRHMITLPNALIAGFQHIGGTKKQERLTIHFSEHLFNGIRNIPIPHVLFNCAD